LFSFAASIESGGGLVNALAKEDRKLQKGAFSRA